MEISENSLDSTCSMFELGRVGIDHHIKRGHPLYNRKNFTNFLQDQCSEEDDNGIIGINVNIKTLIYNTTASEKHKIHNKLKELGFKNVFEYAGNEGLEDPKIVYTYMLDLKKEKYI